MKSYRNKIRIKYTCTYIMRENFFTVSGGGVGGKGLCINQNKGNDLLTERKLNKRYQLKIVTKMHVNVCANAVRNFNCSWKRTQQQQQK